MPPMTTSEPGDARRPRDDRSGRRLDQPPSARYAIPDRGEPEGRVGSLAKPVAQALVAAAVGAALLFLVGAVVASTAGLVFVSGAMGAAIGLLLAGASRAPDDGQPALRRGSVLWLAIGIAAAAVIVAAVATWLNAQAEGGTLGLIDYLFETFGPFVPGELLVAVLGAAWGASSGPLQRR
jgi:hypothetical protein